MRDEGGKMDREQMTVNREKKNCGDCLYCKVSAKSTEKYRLCYCAEIGRKTATEEVYWLKKAVCGRFEDMAC